MDTKGSAGHYLEERKKGPYEGHKDLDVGRFVRGRSRQRETGWEFFRSLIGAMAAIEATVAVLAAG